MMTERQRINIENILARYSQKASSVSKSELETFCETLKIISPKSGKPIAISTYMVYQYGKCAAVPSKGMFIAILRLLLNNREKMVAKRGFFA